MWKWETENEPKGVVVIVHDLLEHHEYYDELIVQLRRDGYHVVIGDLPGHGQTTRVNKGHISSFEQYTERLREWHKLAESYELPTFVDRKSTRLNSSHVSISYTFCCFK